MEMISFHTIITTSSFFMMTMLCYAELCYLLTVFTPVHLLFIATYFTVLFEVGKMNQNGMEEIEINLLLLFMGN